MKRMLELARGRQQSRADLLSENNNIFHAFKEADKCCLEQKKNKGGGSARLHFRTKETWQIIELEETTTLEM